MKTTAKKLLHLLRQARSLVLRAELALTLAQVVFGVALIAVPAALVLQVRRRHAAEAQRVGRAADNRCGEQHVPDTFPANP